MRFVFTLTEGQAETLERVRRVMGHRSQAETLRDLIEAAGKMAEDEEFRPVVEGRVVRDGPAVRVTSPGQEARGVFGSETARTPAVQLGPTPRVPGSMLIDKKGKR